MPVVERSTVEKALKNIANWGDTDVFPLPIENHIIHDRGNDVAQLIESMAKDFNTQIVSMPVQDYSTLAPVGYTGFRWVTQIDPVWNAYLLSLTLQIADSIESERLPESGQHVFSYRYRDSQDDSLFEVDGWKRFQARCRELAEAHQYVISVDIADFYARIYHHRLENALRPVDPGSNVSNHIMAILKRLSNNTSYGLPVGGPAARILAELVLNRVDRLISADPTISNFCRYADDYRFFVDDLQSAYQAIGFLSEKLLRNEGLSLQKSKTRIMTSPEYLSTLDPPVAPEGSAAKFLGLHIHYDPYSATPVEDYERLKSQLSEFDILSLLRGELAKGRVHTGLARRLIRALKLIDEGTRRQATLSLLENLEVLAPVIPQVMLAVRSCLDDLADDSLTEQVHSTIRDLIQRRHHIARIELNLAFMIRVLASRKSAENEQCLIQLYGTNLGFGNAVAPVIQRDIMLVFARWRAEYWLSDQKNYIGTAHPWVKRAFIIGSYALGDEGTHWRNAVKSSFPKFDEITRLWMSDKLQIKGWQVPI